MAHKQSKNSSNVRDFITSFGFSREGKDEYTTQDFDSDEKVESSKTVEEEDSELEQYFRDAETTKVVDGVVINQNKSDIDSSKIDELSQEEVYRYIDDIESGKEPGDSFVVDEIDEQHGFANVSISDNEFGAINEDLECSMDEDNGESETASDDSSVMIDEKVDEYINNILENNKKDYLVMQTLDNEQNLASNITRISAGSEINGSLSSTGDILIEGVVVGNISSEGNAIIKGKVTGDVKATYIEIINADVEGAIEANDNVKLTGGSITGDIMAKSVSIDGKVEGNVLADSTCEICSKAIVKGDITASSVSIANNSIINGKLSINRTDSE